MVFICCTDDLVVPLLSPSCHYDESNSCSLLPTQSLDAYCIEHSCVMEGELADTEEDAGPRRRQRKKSKAPRAQAPRMRKLQRDLEPETLANLHESLGVQPAQRPVEYSARGRPKFARVMHDT